MPALEASFDLENPVDRARLANPLLALEKQDGLVVIDEVQKDPGLFPVIRVLVDRPGNQAKFLLLGSSAPGVVKGAFRPWSPTFTAMSGTPRSSLALSARARALPGVIWTSSYSGTGNASALK